jgi:hypothetical protein
MGKRKQYPSDHRRWFRVMEDILDDPKFNGDEWALGAYIRLLAMLNRTKSRDGQIRLSNSQLSVVLGRSRGDLRRKRLARGAHLGLWTAARYADYTLILVHKWPKHQGFTPAELRRDSGETPATTPTPTPTKYLPAGDTVSEVGFAAPDAASKPAKGKPRSEAKRTPKPARSSKPIPDSALDLADQLAARIREIRPDRKLDGSLDAWGRALDLMVRIDGRTPSQIRETIDWLFGPNQLRESFRFEVWSAISLRAKYERIRDQMQRDKPNGKAADEKRRNAEERRWTNEANRMTREQAMAELDRIKAGAHYVTGRERDVFVAALQARIESNPMELH